MQLYQSQIMSAVNDAIYHGKLQTYGTRRDMTAF